MALHLMPFGPPQHTAFIGIGCSHFAAHRYDRAARWAQSGVETNPSSFWGERIVIAAMTRYRRCCSSSPGVDSQQLFAQRLVNAVRTPVELSRCAVRNVSKCRDAVGFGPQTYQPFLKERGIVDLEQRLAIQGDLEACTGEVDT